MFLEKVKVTYFLFCCVVLISAANVFANAESTVQYRIKPVPRADRTELDITVRFTAENENPVKVILPTDCFGTPDIDRAVTLMEGVEGTRVKNGEKTNERMAQPSQNGAVSLKYTLSYDPKIFGDYSYGPNVGKNYFHLAGCQFLLHIGDDDQTRRFEFEFENAPSNWQLYSSYSARAEKFEINSSYENLASGVIGGGEKSYDFTVKGKPVSVFVHGKYDIPDKQIYAAAERIVRLQREWFNDHSQPFYRIVIAPRAGNIAGYAPGNSFICFVKPDITNAELNWLLSHELFHNWLGNKIRIDQPKGDSFIRYEWFTEGVNDYFARKILLEAKLITSEQFAAYVNKDIINIADNPHRTKTLDELAAVAKANQYSTAHKKLSYYRGGLMALNWETQLRRQKAKKDLSDFIRELYKTAAQNGGKIKEQALFDLAVSYGFDIKGDIERHIVRAEPILPLPDSLGKDYRLQEKEIPSFDPGFDILQTFRSGKISGVAPGGAAHKAGLRDGMEFVDIENSNRFANAWYADKPLIVTVRENAQKRRYEYFPHGSPLKLKLFQLR
jgi:predicted metalloprotease with PDZ domain